jgi:hypothetical protein
VTRSSTATTSSCCRAAAAVALLLLATGCFAKGPRFAGYDPIVEGEGRLYVYRPAGSIGQGSPINLDLNGTRLAELRNDGYVSVALPPGSYQLIAGFGGLTPDVRYAFRIAPNRATFCGFGARFGVVYSTISLACSDDADAHYQLGQCKLEPLEPAWSSASAALAPGPPPPPTAEETKCAKQPSWIRDRRTSPGKGDDECR